MMVNPIEILLVEDNAGDIRLTREALKEGKVLNKLTVVQDGVEALLCLRQQGQYAQARRPDLILLDLNLPKKDGREVLQEIKNDELLKRIPVVILTTSQDEQDVLKTYASMPTAISPNRWSWNSSSRSSKRSRTSGSASSSCLPETRRRSHDEQTHADFDD